jgi:hypothetical protein
MPFEAEKPRMKESRKKAPRKRPRNARRLVFPQAKGRTVEWVELSTDLDFPCVSIRFQDSTDLTVVIDPLLTFSASFSKWKEGNERVLMRWPMIRSE